MILLLSLLYVFVQQLNGLTSQVDAQIILGFSLVRTPTTFLGPLPTNVNLAVVGRNLTVIANVSSYINITRVRFRFDNVFVRDERITPYSLTSTRGMSLTSYPNLTIVGNHVIMAEAFLHNGTISRRAQNFTVIDRMNVPTVAPSFQPSSNVVSIKGELRKWHKVTLAFVGPFADESDPRRNPFMDYRLDVVFTHSSTSKYYKVPGYFAADGDAAETSASSGNIWHCHFAPDEIGTWTYRASFVSGVNISVSTLPGTPIAFDGYTGSLRIANTNKTGRDHRGKGRLKYVGQHHLQFAETGEWFLKAGPDSPENFLAYIDFDNTPNIANRRKSWGPHQRDFVSGIDPSWQNGKGTGIIGAINYLSDQAMNVFSFLTNSLNGDDKNVFPYINSTNFLRMDVSKLAQWEVVFEHADKMGMFLHFKLAEQENDQLLDGGNLGNERKLYYREMIARFGHHLALNWNLAEEITNTVPQINSFISYFRQVDPYEHIVVFHTWKDSSLYSNFLGNSGLGGASLQLTPTNVFEFTWQWVRESAAAGHKWIVTNDEQGPAGDGVLPDSLDPNHDLVRQHVLWGNIMAGGAGVEYFFGGDLTFQDYRSRHLLWAQSRYALELFRNNNIPFWNMSYDRNNRVNNITDLILVDPSNTILILYRPITRTTSNTINMRNVVGPYSVHWYNPRTGGSLQNGSITSIMSSGANVNTRYGSSPNPLDEGKDWVVLFRKL